MNGRKLLKRLPLVLDHRSGDGKPTEKHLIGLGV
jgi:hypothetical protein